MKFKVGKFELGMIFFVVIYLILDIADITQYGFLKHINTTLLNAVLVPVFIFIVTVYYNFSFYKVKSLKDNLNDNTRIAFDMFNSGLLKNDSWLYMKRQKDLGMSRNICKIKENFINPPTSAYQGISIVGLGKNNLVFEYKNIYLTIALDKRVDSKELKYYIINENILEFSYQNFLNYIQDIKSDLMLLRSNVLADVNQTDKKLEILENKILKFLNRYTETSRTGIPIKKNIKEQYDPNEYSDKEKEVININFEMQVEHMKQILHFQLKRVTQCQETVQSIFWFQKMNIKKNIIF